MQVIAVESQFAEFPIEFPKLDAQIEHGPDEHVTADSAEDIEVKAAHEMRLCLFCLLESVNKADRAHR